MDHVFNIGGKKYYSLFVGVDESTHHKRIIVTDSLDLVSSYARSGIIGNSQVYILPYSAFTDNNIGGKLLDDIVLDPFKGQSIDFINYTHYKDDRNEYKILGCAFDLSAKKEFVIYKSLYKGDYAYGTIWLRDRELFFGNVDTSDYKGPRFNAVKN